MNTLEVQFELQSLFNKYLVNPPKVWANDNNVQVDEFFVYLEEVDQKSIKGTIKVPGYRLEELVARDSLPDLEPDVDVVDLLIDVSFRRICETLIVEYLRNRIKNDTKII